MRLLLVVSVLLLASCSTNSLEERVDAHPDYDISRLKTFSWSTPPVEVIGILSGAGQSRLTRRAKAVGESILVSKGYTRAGSKKPDMIASVMIGAINQSTISHHSVDAQQGYYDRTVSWTQENDFLRGGFAIVLTHPKNGKIMWQGTAIDNLKNRKKASGQRVDEFGERVGKMLPASQ